MKKYDGSLVALLAVFIIVLSVFVVLNTYKTGQQSTQSIQPVSQSIVVSSSKARNVIEPEENAKMAATRDLEDFISRFYQRYPLLQKEVDSKNINKVLRFNSRLSRLDSVVDRSGFGWLVEVQNEGYRNFSYYLVHPQLEKKLVDVSLKPEESACQVEEVDLVNGKIILTGSCSGEPLAEKFISVYKLLDGEKVLLTGTSVAKIVSSTGNALGRLRGIFGAENPTLVVEYGLYDSTSIGMNFGPYSEANGMAFFDLETGRLNQFVTIE